MGDIYMTNKAGSTLVKLTIAWVILFLILVGYVFFQSYQGRVDLVTSQRRSCELTKRDRAANARGWRTEEAARIIALAEARYISSHAAKQLITQDPMPNDLPDLIAARRYNKIASNLERRSRIHCAQAFPKAGFFP